MPGGITIEASDRRPYSDTFRRYAEWNHREGADLFVDQTRKLATELYIQTAAIAPTKAEIDLDVRRHMQSGHWDIPVKFADGRTGRGVAKQALGFAWKRKRKKDRGKKDAFMGRARPTTAQVIAFVIKLRMAASLYLASGWLGAILDLGGQIKNSSGHVDRARGGADIQRTPAGVEITLWNRTPGIEEMEGKRGFVEKAIAVRVADMWVYIQRKMSEAQGAIFRRTS